MAQSVIPQVKHTADGSKNPGKPISISCNLPSQLELKLIWNIYEIQKPIRVTFGPKHG